jgi:peroxiredoxin
MNLSSLLLAACVQAESGEPVQQAAPAAPAAVAPVDAELQKLESARTLADASAALDALLASHRDAKELARAAQLLTRRHVSLASEKFLRAVAADSASKEARGTATWALAQVLMRFDASLEFLADPTLDAQQREAYVDRRGKELIAALEQRDRAALKQEAEALLQRVVDDYYFIDYAPTGYLGASADQQLFELRNLQLGMVAPEIEGVDEDGVPFALSDYRGKVVALDFWGFWCPICVRNLPSERATVEKLKDAPFALVGVNSDPKADLKTAARYEKVVWRSFWDGPDAYGPIATRWNVRSWPTIYVLDENGVIRLKTEDAELMAKKVDELLAAMQAKESEAAAKKGGSP